MGRVFDAKSYRICTLAISNRAGEQFDAKKKLRADARNLSGASFQPKTAQNEISLASVRLGSSYSPKASHCQKLDFLARAAQIDAAAAPAQALDHKEISP